MATTVTTSTVTPADPLRHDHGPVADGHGQQTRAGAVHVGHGHAAHLHGAAGHDAHVHGDMDVRGHERTFDAFVKFLAWNAVACLAILVFLALTNA